jgi:SAM-dependent methyltransferase
VKSSTVCVVAAIGCTSGAHRSPAPAPPAAAAHDHHHHHHGPVDHDFSDAKKWAEVFDDPERDTWQHPDEVVALLNAGPGQIVADLGAGTGYFERYLTRAVGGAGQVLALDTEPHMVEYIRQRALRELWGNVTATVVTATDPGLPLAGVDRVLIVNTWHHLPDRANYATVLATALRPGGAIAVVDFTIESPTGPPPALRVAADTVVAELAAAGLHAVIASESLPNQYIVVAIKPTRSRP